MSGLATSDINYIDPANPVKPRKWNPGGSACSNKCGYCWSRAFVERFGDSVKCEKCRKNEVHTHWDRLDEPTATKDPKIVLVNFTCDTFDRERPLKEVYAVLDAAARAPQHTYVFLTKNPVHMHHSLHLSHHYTPGNWHLGLTLTCQAEADKKLADFLQILGNLWISYEPAHGDIDWDWVIAKCQAIGKGRLRGVIIGHDNRRGAPGTDTLDHIYSAVDQCVEAGVKVYIKQIFIDGRLEHDPSKFPPDLRYRELPWSRP